MIKKITLDQIERNAVVDGLTRDETYIETINALIDAVGGGGSDDDSAYLTTLATTNRVRVRITGTQNFAADDQQHVIPFNNPVEDPGSHWDNTNFRFVVSQAGDYLIVLTAAANATWDQLIIRVNGSGNPIDWDFNSSYNNFDDFQVIGLRHLAVNDYIEAVGVIPGGGTKTLSTNFCNLSIRFLG